MQEELDKWLARLALAEKKNNIQEVRLLKFIINGLGKREKNITDELDVFSETQKIFV